MKPSLLSLLILTTACTATEPDGRDDVVIGDDKSDAWGFKDGTYEAVAMVKVANTLSLAQLKSVLGVSDFVAKQIIVARPFGTLARLDRVPYTGLNFFRALSDYVVANNLVGYCGDGEPQDGNGPEECDFAAGAPYSDGCSTRCLFELPLPGEVCGDGGVDPTDERCDDGNLIAGDGCSAVCTEETWISGVTTGSPNQHHRHFVSTVRGYNGNSGSQADASISVKITVYQATTYMVDVAAFHTMPWGTNSPADWVAFRDEVARHTGTEKYPGFGYVPLSGTLSTAGPSFALPFDLRANVTLSTPSNATGWDRSFVLQPGVHYVSATLHDWYYTAETWAGISMRLIPVGSAGPACGNGVEELGEVCDDGNNESGDGCSEFCSVLETYHEAKDLLNDDRLSEPANRFRVIYGSFVSRLEGRDRDMYTLTLDRPRTVTLYDNTNGATCTAFDGSIYRGTWNTVTFTPLESSTDTPDGCARISLPAGTHTLRLSKSGAYSEYDSFYRLQVQ